MLKDPSKIPMEWTLGRIEGIHPGSDGLVRVIRIRTSRGVFTRTAASVCPLPFEDVGPPSNGGGCSRLSTPELTFANFALLQLLHLPHQAQAAPSLGAPVSSRTMRRRLTEGHLKSWRPLCVLPLTPTHRRLHLEWCHVPGNWIAAEWNQVFSDESKYNLNSDNNRVREWRLPQSCLCFTASHRSHSWCDGMGCHCHQ
ncbi:transposable element Tcb2 transposase [Trichonephila clavipes]|nr:transposable element Tcb2 transposase [Trichonephila clavipes]